jgi:hemoglobin/transferrin/lactoferrin receptor protein
MHTGEPVESVAIFNQNKINSTLSDERGVADISNFVSSDTLFFQHPAYERYAMPYTSIVANNLILLVRKNILIEEFVITASKHREKKRDVPYKVDVLTSQKLAFIPSQNSADLLGETGNVFVQKSQAGGGSPVIRGFEANKVLLVVDGVRMNNAIYRSGHLQNALTIDNAVLERVEIIYGPSSVIYGSDALGGVIHYITKTPELNDSIYGLKLNGSAYVQGASASMSNKSHIDLNFGFKKLAFLSSFTSSNFGDIKMGTRRSPFLEDWGKYPTYVKRINGKDTIVANSNSNVVPFSGYQQIDLMQKLRYKINRDVALSLNFQYSTSTDINRQDQLNNVLDDGSPEFSEWYYGPQDRMLASVKSTIYTANNFFNTMEVTLAYQDISESRITRAYQSDTLFNQQEGVKIGSGNFDFYKELNSRSNVSYGFDVNYNRVSSDAFKQNISTDISLPDITRYPDEGTNTLATGAYVSYKVQLMPKAITSVGLRYQQYALNAMYGDYYNDLPTVFRDVDLATQAITSSLSFIVNQTRSFTWNAVLSTGFRSPNLDDLSKIRLTSGKLTLPNSELVPEYSYNAEIGVSKVFDGYIQLNANYFVTYLTNAITRESYTFDDGSDSIYFQGSYRTTYQNKNTSEALLHGFSVNMNSDLNSNVRFRSTLNYTYGHNITDNTPLASIPPIFGRTDFSYELEKFTAEIYFLYAGWKKIEDMVTTGEDKEDEATEYGFPGWYTINFNSSYTINNYLLFQFAVENLTNNFYKPFASGVPGPGINFVATLRVEF